MPKQHNPIDSAIKAVRDFQSGKVDSDAVKAALAALDRPALQWVSIGTRLPVGTLEGLRG